MTARTDQRHEASSREVCAVTDCERSREKRDWCGTHYQRYRVHGDPLIVQSRGHAYPDCSVEGCTIKATTAASTLCKSHIMAADTSGLHGLPASIAARIRFPADADDGCWIWTAHVASMGYGYMRWHGRATPAHRVIYSLLVGAIPPGYQIDHLCRNRLCVRPDHLEAVTPTENILRARRVIEAERPEICQSCDDGIRPGQLIEPVASGWQHDRCPTDTETL